MTTLISRKADSDANLLSFPFERRNGDYEPNFNDSHLSDDPLEDLMNEFAYLEDELEKELQQLESKHIENHPEEENVLNLKGEQQLMDMLQAKLSQLTNKCSQMKFYTNEIEQITDLT